MPSHLETIDRITVSVYPFHQVAPAQEDGFGIGSTRADTHAQCSQQGKLWLFEIQLPENDSTTVHARSCSLQEPGFQNQNQ